MGRPPKDPYQVRSISITLKLSPDEDAQLRELAEQLRLPFRTFLRSVVLGKKLPPPIPAVNQQLARELARVGGNLNQFLHAVHTGKVEAIPYVDLLGLRDLLAEVRRQLRGDGESS
jgi:mobilization protein NikA